MKAITKRLARMRFDRNRMSQRDTAAKASMSLQRYWEIENGYRELEPDDVRGLAKAFRCSQAEVTGASETESVAS